MASPCEQCGITEPSGKEKGFLCHAQLLNEVSRQDALLRKTKYVCNKVRDAQEHLIGNKAVNGKAQYQ